jgi:hypothetical protein
MVCVHTKVAKQEYCCLAKPKPHFIRCVIRTCHGSATIIVARIRFIIVYKCKQIFKPPKSQTAAFHLLPVKLRIVRRKRLARRSPHVLERTTSVSSTRPKFDETMNSGYANTGTSAHLRMEQRRYSKKHICRQTIRRSGANSFLMKGTVCMGTDASLVTTFRVSLGLGTQHLLVSPDGYRYL